MKHSIFYAFVILIFASCSSTKTMAPAAVTPVGDWDYSITGTPDGDFKGVLNVTSTGDVYAAKMISANGTIPLEKVAYNKDTKKITGEIPYNGFMVALDATLNGDELTGQTEAGGMTFPFKASRKK